MNKDGQTRYFLFILMVLEIMAMRVCVHVGVGVGVCSLGANALSQPKNLDMNFWSFWGI